MTKYRVIEQFIRNAMPYQKDTTIDSEDGRISKHEITEYHAAGFLMEIMDETPPWQSDTQPSASGDVKERSSTQGIPSMEKTYVACRAFNAGGRQFNQGDKVTGLAQSEISRRVQNGEIQEQGADQPQPDQPNT